MTSCECGGEVVSSILWPYCWKEYCRACGGYVLIQREGRDWENNPPPKDIVIKKGVQDDTVL